MSHNIWFYATLRYVFQIGLLVLGHVVGLFAPAFAQTLPAPDAAQEFSYGLKAGLNFGSVVGPIEEGSGARPVLLPNAGLYVNWQFSPRWTLGAELGYSQKGADFWQDFKQGETMRILVPSPNAQPVPVPYKAYNMEGKMNLTYLELPLTVGYRYGKKGGNIRFGGYVSYLLEGESYSRPDSMVIGRDGYPPLAVLYDTTYNIAPYLRRWDYGAVAGSVFHLKGRFDFAFFMSCSLRSLYRKELTELEATFLNVFMQGTLRFRLGMLPK